MKLGALTAIIIAAALPADAQTARSCLENGRSHAAENLVSRQRRYANRWALWGECAFTSSTENCPGN
jgi:hypothetical protein